MISFTMRIRVPPDKRDDLLNTLRPFLGPTCVLPGCQSCRLYEDIEDAEALMLLEEWTTGEDLARHIRSDGYRRVLTAMEMSSQAPEVAFNTVGETQGMEFIEAVRLTGAGKASSDSQT